VQTVLSWKRSPGAVRQGPFLIQSFDMTATNLRKSGFGTLGASQSQAFSKRKFQTSVSDSVSARFPAGKCHSGTRGHSDVPIRDANQTQGGISRISGRALGGEGNSSDARQIRSCTEASGPETPRVYLAPPARPLHFLTAEAAHLSDPLSYLPSLERPGVDKTSFAIVVDCAQSAAGRPRSTHSGVRLAMN
jgi:hypothetical protein